MVGFRRALGGGECEIVYYIGGIEILNVDESWLVENFGVSFCVYFV